MITRQTRNSLKRVRVHWGVAIFDYYNTIEFYSKISTFGHSLASTCTVVLNQKF